MTRLIAVILVATAACCAQDGRLFVGWAGVDVTPDRPVAIGGQMHTRISSYVQDPLTATALALETRDRKGAGDQAILVSLDGPGRNRILEKVQERLNGKLPGFDLRKLVLNATHTHTAPETDDDMYEPPPAGGMRPSEYLEFLCDRLAQAVIQAWDRRRPASVSWALGYAAVGHNRRVSYFDGKTAMYGGTDTPRFSHVEGFEDPGVQMLFFWDQDKALTGVAIHLACPSQQVEGEYYLSADFWGDVRKELRRRYSRDLYVYAMSGAAGDQSPRPMYRQRAEARMRQRRGLTATEEIARRIANAVDDVMEVARRETHAQVPFVHKAGTLRLPARKVTPAEYEAARAEYAKLSQPDTVDPHRGFKMHFGREVMERYERQTGDPFYVADTHVIRLGEIAIATSPFELFLDYGVRIEARSRAEQTFVVQLACGYGGYLPTAKALAGGSYSVGVASNLVGPEGGQVLVERTVELINSLWEK